MFYWLQLLALSSSIFVNYFPNLLFAKFDVIKGAFKKIRIVAGLALALMLHSGIRKSITNKSTSKGNSFGVCGKGVILDVDESRAMLFNRNRMQPNMEFKMF